MEVLALMKLLYTGKNLHVCNKFELGGLELKVQKASMVVK